MSSKSWIEKVVAKPAPKQDGAYPGKRARLADMLLATKTKKG